MEARSGAFGYVKPADSSVVHTSAQTSEDSTTPQVGDGDAEKTHTHESEHNAFVPRGESIEPALQDIPSPPASTPGSQPSQPTSRGKFRLSMFATSSRGLPASGRGGVVPAAPAVYTKAITHNRGISDPLTLAALPPSNETPLERKQRLKEEAEAKYLSDLIDAQLEEERLQQKRQKEIKLLLLGQSGSGKSTIVKQFQLMFTSSKFYDRHFAHRGVIYLNIISSVRRIVDAVTAEFDGEPKSGDHPSDVSGSLWSERRERFDALKLRLKPVMSLEEALARLFTGEVPISDNANFESAWDNHGGGADLSHIVAASKQDIITLWHDSHIRDILSTRKLCLEESSRFFLDEIDRLATLNYTPTEDDVLKAQLKTLGVVEHTFNVGQSGLDSGVPWKIYDVGGARSQRHAWIPYFDAVAAIVFLAPISAFDETLSEDPTVNRLQDSLILWQSICSNKLIANISIIVILNKIDLLRAKLEAGVKVCSYMTSYGDRPNDYASVSNYLKSKFLAIHKHYSQNREVYVCLTSTINRQMTLSIISNVRDILMRNSLKTTQLL